MSSTGYIQRISATNDFELRGRLIKAGDGLEFIKAEIPMLYWLIRSVVSGGYCMYLYGGASRKFLSEDYTAPRDFDFAVDSGALSSIEQWLNGEQIKAQRNRFGGLRFHLHRLSGERCQNVYVDCWEISNTWAFKNCHLSFKSWRDLAHASILSIDGAVIRIDTELSVDVECGPYMKSVTASVIDLEFPYTYNWTIALFRALSLAHELNFNLSKRLQDQISNELGDQLDAGLFVNLLQKRYSPGERGNFVGDVLIKRVEFKGYTPSLISVLLRLRPSIPEIYKTRSVLRRAFESTRQLMFDFGYF